MMNLGTFPWIALLVYTENGKIPVWPIMSCGKLISFHCHKIHYSKKKI